MSNEHLDQFLARLNEDQCLRERLGADHVSAADITAFAARHGFFFTSEELTSQVQPLSDEEWAASASRFGGNHSDCYILFLEEAPMSKEALSAFFKKVADDEGLQKKLIEFAAAQGFEFSADELSDSDLDSAAGGLLSIPITSTLAGKVENLIEHKLTDLVDPSVQDLKSIKIDDLGL